MPGQEEVNAQTLLGQMAFQAQFDCPRISFVGPV